MHLPKRARGLVLGFLMLVAGPATAVLITTPTQGAVASASLARSSVGEIDRLTNVTTHPMMLRVRSAMPISITVAAPVVKPVALRKVRVGRPDFVVPSGLSVSQAQVVADITAAAQRWGVNVAWMLRTANCESHFHWNSVNPRGPYIGVFQFLTSTFRANGGTNIWDATDQANIAAKMLAHGQAHEWSCA